MVTIGRTESESEQLSMIGGVPAEHSEILIGLLRREIELPNNIINVHLPVSTPLLLNHNELVTLTRLVRSSQFAGWIRSYEDPITRSWAIAMIWHLLRWNIDIWILKIDSGSRIGDIVDAMLLQHLEDLWKSREVLTNNSLELVPRNPEIAHRVDDNHMAIGYPKAQTHGLSKNLCLILASVFGVIGVGPHLMLRFLPIALKMSLWFFEMLWETLIGLYSQLIAKGRLGIVWNFMIRVYEYFFRSERAIGIIHQAQDWIIAAASYKPKVGQQSISTQSAHEDMAVGPMTSPITKIDLYKVVTRQSYVPPANLSTNSLTSPSTSSSFSSLKTTKSSPKWHTMPPSLTLPTCPAARPSFYSYDASLSSEDPHTAPSDPSLLTDQHSDRRFSQVCTTTTGTLPESCLQTTGLLIALNPPVCERRIDMPQTTLAPLLALSQRVLTVHSEATSTSTFRTSNSLDSMHLFIIFAAIGVVSAPFLYRARLLIMNKWLAFFNRGNGGTVSEYQNSDRDHDELHKRLKEGDDFVFGFKESQRISLGGVDGLDEERLLKFGAGDMLCT
ncbi:hypothetical protein WAI453_013710 [Rhynchosporium graminicola]